MTDRRSSLYVLFTMDCHPAGTRTAPEGPRHWEQSIRSIDGFRTQLLNRGYAATLFLSPGCARAHAPLVEELRDSDVELGLFVHPPSLVNGAYRAYLGQYDDVSQRAIIALAMEAYQDAVGARPVSVRSAHYSANDVTYALLVEHGFRQGSLSSPGRRVSKHGADWSDAETDPHYAHRANRLRPGDLPFLEIPVTTDATQTRGGVAPELALENGTLEKWHQPLIDGQLERMEREAVPFKALCFITRNFFAYNARGDTVAATLDAVLDYLDRLRDRYEVVPVTASGAHAAFRAQVGEE
jgi:hypothetical protein